MNVLLLIIDTLRFDVLGVNGSEYNVTPNLDKFANKYTHYSSCYSAAPWTLPSCASILTGYYASNHNLMNHYQKLLKKPISTYLKDEGYDTIAITNNSNFAPNIGYQNHFDEYYFYPDGNRKIQIGIDIDHEKPFEIAEEVLSRKSENQFLFLHTNIVHDYYLERNLDYCEFANATQWHPDVMDMMEIKTTLADYLVDEASDDLYAKIFAKYLAGVKYMDHKVGELLNKIDLDNTLLFIVSDHGEGFDYKNHRIHHGGRLHNDQIHVPMMSNLSQSGKHDDLVSTTDIVPTILSAVTNQDVKEFDGVPIKSDNSRELYSEDFGYIYFPDSFKRVSYKSENTFGTKGVITKDSKIIRTDIDENTYFYKYNLSDYGDEESLDLEMEDKEKLSHLKKSRPFNLESYSQLLKKSKVLETQVEELREVVKQNAVAQAASNEKISTKIIRQLKRL